MLTNEEERMSQKISESRAAPAAAMTMIAEAPANYALAAPIAGLLSSAPEAAFDRQRHDMREADRPFLLCFLSDVMVTTVTCGAIAMSAVVMMPPGVN